MYILAESTITPTGECPKCLARGEWAVRYRAQQTWYNGGMMTPEHMRVACPKCSYSYMMKCADNKEG